jgi:hypothetical protein
MVGYLTVPHPLWTDLQPLGDLFDVQKVLLNLLRVRHDLQIGGHTSSLFLHLAGGTD